MNSDAQIRIQISRYATGPAIVIVGSLMFEHCRHIDWMDPKKAIPAFLTFILMPLTYSIAVGENIARFTNIGTLCSVTLTSS